MNWTPQSNEPAKLYLDSASRRKLSRLIEHFEEEDKYIFNTHKKVLIIKDGFKNYFIHHHLFIGHSLKDLIEMIKEGISKDDLMKYLTKLIDSLEKISNKYSSLKKNFIDFESISEKTIKEALDQLDSHKSNGGDSIRNILYDEQKVIQKELFESKNIEKLIANAKTSFVRLRNNIREGRLVDKDTLITELNIELIAIKSIVKEFISVDKLNEQIEAINKRVRDYYNGIELSR